MADFRRFTLGFDAVSSDRSKAPDPPGFDPAAARDSVRWAGGGGRGGGGGGGGGGGAIAAWGEALPCSAQRG